MNRFDIIDFGSQYTHLIAKKLRQLGYFSLIKSPNEYTIDNNVLGIFLSGGPHDVDKMSLDDIYNIGKICRIARENNIVTIGICFGFQLLSTFNNGKIIINQDSHYGETICHNTEDNNFFRFCNNIDLPCKVWMSHQNSIKFDNNPNIELLKSNDDIIGFHNHNKLQIGYLFHPEVEHTESNLQWFINIIDYCKECNPLLFSNIEKINWNEETMYKSIVDNFGHVKNKNILLAASGGIDSTIAALLLKNLGANVDCYIVNHGFLRKNEVEEVISNFRIIGLNSSLHIIDAQKLFWEQLENINNSSVKRKIIGKRFIEAFVESANKNSVKYDYFAQGTIYPDIIESGYASTNNCVIKSHHNVGGLANILLEQNNLTLIEPLKFLYKDDVRRLGAYLQVPNNILNRQPFPGPGLAIRIIGNLTKKRVEILQNADDIVTNIFTKYELFKKLNIWQQANILIPDCTTGVIGDQGIIGHVLVIRAVHSVDGMTANAVDIPFDIMKEITNTVVNNVHEIIRVVYDYTSKPPGTIEWE